MKYIYLGIILSFVLLNSVFSQTTAKTDSLLLRAKKVLNESIEAWDDGAILNSRAHLERLLKMDSTSFLCRYYIAYADFRLVSFYHSHSNNDKIEKAIEDAIKQLDKVIELNPDFADAYALLSNMYGEKIAVSPIKSIYYGPKAGSARGKALDIEPDNPRAYLLDGTGKYFTPKLFGGGAENAQASLLKAVECFKSYKPKSVLYPDWGEREAYAWLGIIAKDMGDIDQAKTYFNQALEIDPDYGWVKYHLLPDLEKAMVKADE